MRLLYMLMLLAAPFGAFAAEVTETVTSSGLPADAPWWVHTIWPILTLTVIPWLVRFLRNKGTESKHRADQAAMEASSALGKAKNQFIDGRLIPFLWNASAHLADTKLPGILRDAVDGGGFDWKQHALDLKNELKVLAINKFKAEGLDLVETMGEDYLDSLLDRAVAKALPFLPQVVQGAANPELTDKITDKVSNLIVSKGLGYAREHWLDDDKE